MCVASYLARSAGVQRLQRLVLGVLALVLALALVLVLVLVLRVRLRALALQLHAGLLSICIRMSITVYSTNYTTILVFAISLRAAPCRFPARCIVDVTSIS